MYQNDTKTVVSNVTPFPRPINWSNLRTDEAERIIRQRAQITGAVIFTDHTWDRVSERDIPREDVTEILLKGHCHEQPFRNEKGNWQVLISKRLSGSREAGAVTVILEEAENLVIRTVEWVDPK